MLLSEIAEKGRELMTQSRLTELKIQKLINESSNKTFEVTNKFISHMNSRGLLNSGITLKGISDNWIESAYNVGVEALSYLVEDIADKEPKQHHFDYLKEETLKVFDDFMDVGNKHLEDWCNKFNGFLMYSEHELVVSNKRQSIINDIELKIEELKIKKVEVIKEIQPPLSIENLHPNIIKVSEKLFYDGHYRSAVLDSYIDLINRVKELSGRSDLDGSPLMQQVFSIRTPKLIISDDQDEQQGFMWLFSGAVMAIRNPKAHKIIEITDPQRTVEWLAFASVLHRVLDDLENGRNS
ncbi:TIGR02391 family protein [Paenibacillus rhizolycopersici]|uniref:TIGR02391 family protein n=1 Tax=Paenibacillus rhizolycopersici TaxID=2780073 RepID=UPI003D2D1799